MTLSEKVAYLMERKSSLTGYMVRLVENASQCIKDGRIDSIGHNTVEFINRAYPRLRYW